MAEVVNLAETTSPLAMNIFRLILKYVDVQVDFYSPFLPERRQQL